MTETRNQRRVPAQPARTACPPWCGEDCSAGSMSGYHRSASQPVQGDDGRVLATVVICQRPGMDAGIAVEIAAGTLFYPESADRLAAAVKNKAAELRRVQRGAPVDR